MILHLLIILPYDEACRFLMELGPKWSQGHDEAPTDRRGIVLKMFGAAKASRIGNHCRITRVGWDSTSGTKGVIANMPQDLPHRVRPWAHLHTMGTSTRSF